MVKVGRLKDIMLISMVIKAENNILTNLMNMKLIIITKAVIPQITNKINIKKGVLINKLIYCCKTIKSDTEKSKTTKSKISNLNINNSPDLWITDHQCKDKIETSNNSNAIKTH